VSKETLSEEQNAGQDAAFPITPPLDGGQAAPGYYCQQYGLSKREIFAMAAMQGIFAHGYTMPNEGYEAAKYAVEAADLLLKELAK
jgi:hypothetical protein